MTHDRHADRPDERQLQDLIDECRDALELLDRGREAGPKGPLIIPAAELLQRAQRGTRDGYRSSTIGGGGGPGSVLDDQGVPMPPVNDPTGELAAGDAAVDTVRRLGIRVARSLQAAAADLRSAVSALADATPPVTVDDEPGCSNHRARIGAWEPVHRDGRCRWCYDWWLAHGQDAPSEILEARARGARITTKLVAQVSGPRHAKNRRPSGVRR